MEVSGIMLTICHLNPNPHHISEQILEDVQQLLERSPHYFLKVSEQPARPNEAHEMFFALPDIFELEQKLCFGFYRGADELMGFSEVLKGHPTPLTGYIGLHLIADSLQGQGLGKATYELLENTLKQMCPEMNTLRLGVALSNPVENFWAKMGYVKLPGLKTTLENQINSQVFEMEKALA